MGREGGINGGSIGWRGLGGSEVVGRVVEGEWGRGERL